MPDSSKPKLFEFPNLVSQFGGYFSSIDRTNIATNLMVQGSQNIYKKLSGTLAVRQGQKRQGVANAVLSPISSEFVWYSSTGNTYTMTVSNGALWVVFNKVWYRLMTFTQTRFVFDKWWKQSASQDILLFVNGTSNLYEWDGGFALVGSTTVNTIVLDRTVVLSGLPASGTVIINGTTYTYTGSSGSTLTGVTPDPTGEANGSGVLAPVITHPNAYATSTGLASLTLDFLRVINNQVYLGSYTDRRIAISSNTDFTNYVVPVPRLAGSPELVVLDGNGKGIGVRQGNATIGYGTSGWAIISFQDITVGTTLTNITTRTLKPVAALQAPLGHEFIDMVNDNIIYLAQDHQLRAFGDFNDLFVTGYPSYSQEVASELSAENFTGGSVHTVGEYTYISAPTSGKVYIRQERTSVSPGGVVVSEKLWHSPFIWNATAVDELDGVTVVFSNANPQIYEVWDTNQWHDDSPSGEFLPYNCILAFGYRGEKRRQGMWSGDKIFSEGYLSPGTPLGLLVNYNFQGSTNAINVPINSLPRPAYLFQSPLASLGDSSLGEESLGDQSTVSSSTGGNINVDLVPKFKVISSLPIINCFEWQPVYYSNQADANWEILATADNFIPEDDQVAGFIINKLR